MIRTFIRSLLKWRQMRRHYLSKNLLKKKDDLVNHYNEELMGRSETCLAMLSDFCEISRAPEPMFTDSEISKFKTTISKLIPGYEKRGLRLGALDGHEDVFFSVCSLFENLEILEVGVANGYSSAIFHEALSKKGSGRIVSIDQPIFEEDVFKKSSLINLLKSKIFQFLADWAYPNNEDRPSYLWRGGVIPSSKYSGWLIDPEKRMNVNSKLIIGDVYAVIKEINLGKFNVILLDAMKDEQDRLKLLDTIFPLMADSGIIIQDGAWRNEAVKIFAERNGLSYIELGRIALIRN